MPTQQRNDTPKRLSARTNRPSLAPSLDVVDLTVARAFELNQLRRAANSISGNRRVFQQLSWHARRRTMSHSSRRMPVRLRLAHQRELALQRGGAAERKTGVRGKMRLRKYRKKARFLQAVRKLRNRKNGWLETHVWFAKRFKMGELKGVNEPIKVPMSCNDRGKRSCWKAVKRTCVIHDASYLVVIDIQSKDKEQMKSALKIVLQAEDAGRVCADPVTEGRRIVRNLCFHDEEEKTVGSGDILWHPRGLKLWIWVRPEVATDVIEVFQKLDVNANFLETAPLQFQVLGPRAGVVLNSVLDLSYGQAQFIGGTRSSACLPEGSVFADTCQDPRTDFPRKNMNKCGKDIKEFGDELMTAFQSVGTSQLWQSERRKYLYDYVVDGKEKGVKVPYIIIQRAGKERFGAGWDLVIPAGWGMAFWSALMYSNGNRAMGMEELRFISLEAGWPIFPEELLDCRAGISALKEEEASMQEAYARRPKAKRVNHDMYRIRSPMFPDLTRTARIEKESQLRESVEPPPLKKTKEDEGASTISEEMDFLIVRGRTALIQLIGYDTYQALTPRTSMRGKSPKFTAVNSGVQRPLKTSFVLLRISSYRRGVPNKNAVLYMPTIDDLKEITENGGKRYAGFREALDKTDEKSEKAMREEIGYVLYGDFSLGNGEGMGISVVCSSALKRILELGGHIRGRDGGLLVLFRNVSSLHYRAAVAQLVT